MIFFSVSATAVAAIAAGTYRVTHDAMLTLVCVLQLLNSIFSGTSYDDNTARQVVLTWTRAQQLMRTMLTGIAEMTFAVERLPTFFKHRNNVWSILLPAKTVTTRG